VRLAHDLDDAPDGVGVLARDVGLLRRVCVEVVELHRTVRVGLRVVADPLPSLHAHGLRAALRVILPVEETRAAAPSARRGTPGAHRDPIRLLRHRRGRQLRARSTEREQDGRRWSIEAAPSATSRAYLAAITYVDGQIGRVLDALDMSPYRDNTIIVFLGDHGWNLGEKHHWRKFALWEESTRAPLIWVGPGVTRTGATSNAPVDFMSIYPTLSELCGLPIPAHVEGPSLKKLLADPAAKWDRPALMTHGYRNHAVRTGQWRYIRYEDGSEELYDARRDPYEWTNLANERKYDHVKAELAKVFPKVNTPEPEAGTGDRGAIRVQ
jgi:arylsulfatase A-like enzyme